MKTILEFTLPEEHTEHMYAANAGRIMSAVFEAQNQVRNWLKYGHEFKTPDEAIEEVRKLLFDIQTASGETE